MRHGIDDFLREGEFLPESREHGLLEGIPESANSIIFLEYPPIPFISVMCQFS